jgi:hypothetical protein
VAHAYNPSYSGGKDQEDHGLKPPQANSSVRSYLEKPFKKKGWRSSSRFRPCVQALIPQKKKKKKKKKFKKKKKKNKKK